VRFLLLLTLLGCRGERTVDEWYGIPADASAVCQWDSAGKIGACIGSGKVYTCVKAEVLVEEPKSWHLRFECARVSAPVLPEEPKSDD
jgi:hypothetical protein